MSFLNVCCLRLALRGHYRPSGKRGPGLQGRTFPSGRQTFRHWEGLPVIRQVRPPRRSRSTTPQRLAVLV